jgi:hypothetical protein
MVLTITVFNIIDPLVFDQATGYMGRVEVQNDGKIVYSSWSTFIRFNVDGSLYSTFLAHTAIDGDITSMTYFRK